MKKAFFLIIILILNGCSEKNIKNDTVASNLIDQKATKETHQLFNRLKKMSGKGMMFGMHDPMGYGVGWENDDRRCDVKSVCGDYPALFSWDFYTLFEGDSQATRMADRITFAYNSGGINTICWHQGDPEQKSFYADNLDYEVFSSLLPDGKYHEEYKNRLRKIANFTNALKGKNGEQIPIIFRPYHEQNGFWFWWGKPFRSEEQYVEMWKFTVDYLKDSLNVHNYIYCFSPDGNQWETKEQYLVDYPGDDYVDMYGVDFYFPNGADSTVQRFQTRCRHIVEYAQEKNKVAATTEVGSRKDWKLSEIAIENWFTKCMLNPIKNDDLARNIVFACVWRNASTDHHFAPFPGHPIVPDFMEFYHDPYTLFLKELNTGKY